MPSPKSLHATGDNPATTEHADPDASVETAEASRVASAAPISPGHVLLRRLWAVATFGFIGWLLLAKLAHFGIWDPWELEVADAARKHLEHGATPLGHDLSLQLVSVGFRAFGIHEWAGRLPIALCGILCALTAFELARRFGDLRTAMYAALIAATSPLLAFNARTMLGTAPDMAVSGALGLCALKALLPSDRESHERAWEPVAWLVACVLLLGLTVATRGVLVGALPPLGAAAAAAWLAPTHNQPPVRRIAKYSLSACLLISITMIGRDIHRDATEYSFWLGGAANSSNPPTFDFVLEQVFHAFAPWSALLPLALSRVPFAAPPSMGSRLAVMQGCTLWIALSYGAQTLFVSRYGHHVTFLAVVPLAMLVATTLRELEQARAPAWGAAIAALLLAGLILRDFVLFPSGIVEGMPLENFEVPKQWNPRGAVAAACIPFGLCAMFGLAVSPKLAKRPNLYAPYHFFAAQWRRGTGFKAWLLALGTLLLAVSVFGALAYAIPQRLHMTSLAVKVVRRLTFTPLAIALVVALGQLSLYAFSRLRTLRFVPLLIAGAAFGGYMAQGYLPQLSEHFSPREVYTAYNQLAAPGAPLAEYRVGGRAAPYYAKGPVVELTSLAQLIDHLAQNGQRWATFPANELATIDHAFRIKTNKHLFVVDAQSARGVLAASEPLPGRVNENKLAAAVERSAPSQIQHPVAVNFDDHIELLGYSLALPHKDYVGAGESFTLTWYFRGTRKLASSYRIFVHIDGEGQRIHGDHDPVDGTYPVTLWEPDDIIVDAQKIDVPASSHAGEYKILMGFYSGDTRLPIRQGPNAGEDRARVGVLRIR